MVAAPPPPRTTGRWHKYVLSVAAISLTVPSEPGAPGHASLGSRGRWAPQAISGGWGAGGGGVRRQRAEDHCLRALVATADVW